MAEQTPQTLSHFSLVTFLPEFHRLPDPDRHARLEDWMQRLRENCDALHLYQVSAFEGRQDLLAWTSIASVEGERVRHFFEGSAAAMAPLRGYATLGETLWGFTKPSPYTRARSTQELDPFVPERLPFLIAYPFVKTFEWYMLDAETRQRMMAGHIKVGTQYKDITQLLLYSFGLQDQEFVVVYETDDLRRFLALVQELRGTEARRYTQRDWPLHTGVHLPDFEALKRWL